MVKLGLYVRLEAKAGKENELQTFLQSALPLAEKEQGMPVWFALRFSPNSFGIFDAFPAESGRQAHLEGPIAAALMAKANDLLSTPPIIEKVDILASKVQA